MYVRIAVTKKEERRQQQLQPDSHKLEIDLHSDDTSRTRSLNIFKWT